MRLPQPVRRDVASATLPDQEWLDDTSELANWLLVCAGVLIALAAWPRWRVAPMVADIDPATDARLTELEKLLRRQPGDGRAAAEVAAIWSALGQPVWSYTALRDAERYGPREPGARLGLAAAYLDLGEPDDAKRVLGEATRLCGAVQPACGSSLRFKLELFTAVADLLIREGIDPRSEPVFRDRAVRRLIKEVALKKRGERPLPPPPPATPTTP